MKEHPAIQRQMSLTFMDFYTKILSAAKLLLFFKTDKFSGVFFWNLRKFMTEDYFFVNQEDYCTLKGKEILNP